jgi:hypothetical protein
MTKNVFETCVLGRENRVMIESMKADIREIKDSIRGLDGKVTELFNHQSNRWPPGAAWALGIIGTLLGVAATFALNNILGA